METYDYLIIGGGMTAAAAVQGIREVDTQGTIGMISAEDYSPYNRPPLTKKLWQGKPEDIIWSKMPNENLEMILDTRIAAIDPAEKKVRDENGRTYAYGRLLLATGGSPRHLPFAPPETVYYRTLNDYHTVRSWMGKKARIGIIGGGFIGSEIAASLASNGEKPIMVFPEPSLGAQVYPADLSDFITRYYREKGVEVHPGVGIEAIDRNDGQFVLRGKDGTSIPVDHIIAGIGIRPNIDLAQQAGIAIAGRAEGGGITVDEFLQTNHPGIYAAGDVASFYNPALGKRMRVEHEDNARHMGKTVGLNMAGRKTPYDYLPYFYSDLFDLGYEAIGELDSRLQTVSDWKDPYHKGIINYLKDEKVRGVLLWNTWGQVDAARKIIAEGQTYSPDMMKSLQK